MHTCNRPHQLVVLDISFPWLQLLHNLHATLPMTSYSRHGDNHHVCNYRSAISRLWDSSISSFCNGKPTYMYNDPWQWNAVVTWCHWSFESLNARNKDYPQAKNYGRYSLMMTVLNIFFTLGLAMLITSFAVGCTTMVMAALWVLASNPGSLSGEGKEKASLGSRLYGYVHVQWRFSTK